ncbi:MAG TPA: tetratricopeptide repeat protein [Gemmatimonadales bacterium]
MVFLALGSSFPSLMNGFAFDDLPVIVQDGRIHELQNPWHFFTQPYWGPPAPPALYRPLTSLAFGLQWKLGGGSALLYHAVNVVLYCVVCLAVYHLAVALLGAMAGWWSAALFAVHPVHTEAVANSVGQSELWSGLLVILAVLFYVRARAGGELGARDIMVLALLYLAACCFKEHAIILPALLVIVELIPCRSSLSTTLWRRDLRSLWCALAVVAVCFWAAHAIVLGNLAGDRPNWTFWGMTLRDRLYTMLAIVPEWLRLLLLPARLKVEYLPQEIHRAYVFGTPQLLGALMAAGIGALAVVAARQIPVFTFGAAWTAATLLPVSNVIVPSGVVLAERTLFLPSIGALMAAGALLLWIAGQKETPSVLRRRLMTAAGVAVLAAGLARSVVRQPVWRSTQTFHDQLLLDAPDSYRAHWIRGQRLLAAHDAAEGEKELARALELFPDDPRLLAEVADRYRGSNRCAEAINLYRHSLEIDGRSYLRRRLIGCLVRLDRLAEAQQEVGEALAGREPGARQDSALVTRALTSRVKPPD